jgi:hypothetical protein
LSALFEIWELPVYPFSEKKTMPQPLHRSIHAAMVYLGVACLSGYVMTTWLENIALHTAYYTITLIHIALLLDLLNA